MSTTIPLPEMNVELRTSTTAWTIPPPDTSTEAMCKQLEVANIMNHEAAGQIRWPEYTVSYLTEHCKINPKPTPAEIRSAIKAVTNLDSWGQVSVFVRDDVCLDFFNLCLKYLRNINATETVDNGFIDGNGVGYVKDYTERLKVTLEQAFDAKYFYQVRRPLVYSLEENQVDLSKVANGIHPGHWSYPAGHGTKFFTAVEVLNDAYTLTSQQYRNLFIAAYVCAMGRSGNLIHYPEDNDKGGYLTTLPEFNTP